MARCGSSCWTPRSWPPGESRLTRTTATSHTGEYSLDGATWRTVATVTVPGQATTQDGGLFVTSHTSGNPATVTFDGFSTSG